MAEFRVIFVANDYDATVGFFTDVMGLEVGTDELIIPDFNLAPEEAPEIAERFMSEVMAAL